MRRPVSRPEQVASNIRSFVRELRSDAALQSALGHIHAWYALRVADGEWIFGPSKFVGYPDNTAQEYLGTYKDKGDGRQTERALSAWFKPVDVNSRLGRELLDALTNFLAAWDRVPRRGVRIAVVSSDDDEPLKRADVNETLFARIATDPRICGGRPCIRGTRMRVSDVVDMLAHGATRQEILEDYPYLADEDITAALAYAARATDHRVIQAA